MAATLPGGAAVRPRLTWSSGCKKNPIFSSTQKTVGSKFHYIASGLAVGGTWRWCGSFIARAEKKARGSVSPRQEKPDSEFEVKFLVKVIFNLLTF